MKQFILGAISAVGIGALGSYGLVQSGSVDFSADTEHSPAVTQLISWAREQSIAKSASDIAPPKDLESAERIRRGAGNYAAMCAECHLSPGIYATEISKGLYPRPPNLSQANTSPSVDHPDARRFWIIKHGIKGSGMPAWWKGGMDDEAIWDLVALVRVLPKFSATDYRAQVAASDGHSHGGMPPQAPAEHPTKPQTREQHSHSHHKHSH